MVEVALLIDDEPRSTTRFAPVVSEIAEALPNGMVAQRRTAQFGVALLAAKVPQRLDCVIRARDADGVIYSRAFVLGIDRAASVPARWLEGPIQPPAAEQVPIPAMLYVERAVLDNGGNLLIERWSLGCDASARFTPISVRNA